MASETSPLIVTGGVPPEMCDADKCNAPVTSDAANIHVSEYQAELLVETSDIKWCEECYPNRHKTASGSNSEENDG